MEMDIRDHWDRLSAATRQWLTDNPGCLILPRTMTERICQETGRSADCDQHGQATLSRGDLDLIRAKGNQIPDTDSEYRFFDATQP
ncbi:hypothetical protein [Arthrobacter sp. ISL-72]|uniref:hypothetical protein n=1 Tax=Arthrobacter sp. ISL-72 TaxID=2819114 RepID=UPI001BE7E9E9|nr:hypothetical protein [Arthrobacter sp. ISL-72]MBT2596952.1 hypothetical protein [Arthrobacter sp. ISL-72]